MSKLVEEDIVIHNGFWGEKPMIINYIFENGLALIDETYWSNISNKVRYCKLVPLSELTK